MPIEVIRRFRGGGKKKSEIEMGRVDSGRRAGAPPSRLGLLSAVPPRVYRIRASSAFSCIILAIADDEDPSVHESCTPLPQLSDSLLINILCTFNEASHRQRLTHTNHSYATRIVRHG